MNNMRNLALVDDDKDVHSASTRALAIFKIINTILSQDDEIGLKQSYVTRVSTAIPHGTYFLSINLAVNSKMPTK